MTHTAKMVEKYLNGYEIVCTWGPRFKGREDGHWPMMYVPRYKTDPRPFVPVGTWNEFSPRYSGGELTALPTAAQKNLSGPETAEQAG